MAVRNSPTQKVIETAEKHWMRLEMDFHYARLSKYEKEAYRLQGKCMENWSNMEWTEFDERLNEELLNVDAEKKKRLDGKRADKSNNIVVKNRDEYDAEGHKFIEEGNYEEIKNPLNKMITKLRETINRTERSFSKAVSKRWTISNPQVPRIYFAPKIHKPGKQVRPVVSNINAPTEKLAKWLVGEYRKIGRIDGLAVSKDVKISRNEVMVSFDVISLYPNIPIPEAISRAMVERAQRGGEQSGRLRLSNEGLHGAECVPVPEQIL